MKMRRFSIYAALMTSCFANATISDEPLADALHAIMSLCITRSEYDVCHSHATAELATCSPDDLNCLHNKIAEILDFCRNICDSSDYVPFAVVNFLQDQDQDQEQTYRVYRRDDNLSPQGTFLAGNKDFTAADINDALTLKQFIETREHPPAAWQMIEDRLKPAVTSVRNSLKQQLPEPAGLNRHTIGGGVDSTVKQNVKDSAAGESRNTPNSCDYVGSDVDPDSHKKRSPYASSIPGHHSETVELTVPVDVFQYRNNKEDTTPAVADINEAQESSWPLRHLQSDKSDETIYLYQDIPTIDVYDISVELLSTPEQKDSSEGVRAKVKSYLNLHMVKTQKPNKQHDSRATTCPSKTETRLTTTANISIGKKTGTQENHTPHLKVQFSNGAGSPFTPNPATMFGQCGLSLFILLITF